MSEQLAALLKKRIDAKTAEDLAVKNRRAIDGQIVALLPKKTEGSVSQEAGQFKVTVTYGIDRKANTEYLQDSWFSLPPAVQKAFRWKAEVSTKEFKALSETEGAIAIDFVESKPSSPSLKVEPI